MLRLSLIIFLALAAASPAAAQRLGTGNPSCYEVQNTGEIGRAHV